MIKGAPRVLVVDDAPEIRTLFTRALTSTGMKVSVAPDGIAGLSEARRRPPDIVVSDLEMPHMNGVELCGALRRDPLTTRVPILIVSGAGSDETQAAIDAGCDAVLEKPVAPSLLVATIIRLLSHRK
jgi:DNA-binding response OmpR family regulator